MEAYDIDSSEVTVEVQGAKVILEGTVPSRHMKHAIEDLVDACPGVQDIENKVRVESPNYQGSIPKGASSPTTPGVTSRSGTQSATTGSQSATQTGAGQSTSTGSSSGSSATGGSGGNSPNGSRTKQ